MNETGLELFIRSLKFSGLLVEQLNRHIGPLNDLHLGNGEGVTLLKEGVTVVKVARGTEPRLVYSVYVLHKQA